MKRLIQTYALAMLLGATCAHALAQTSAGGVADPQAPVPATQARPAIERHTEPAPAASPDRAWRDANATVGGRNAMRLTMPGMDMREHMHEHEGAMQCKKGEGKCDCCADMKMKDGCCCAHKEAP